SDPHVTSCTPVWYPQLRWWMLPLTTAIVKHRPSARCAGDDGVGCGLSENFTLCNTTHKVLFFKVLCAKIPNHTSKLSEIFPFPFHTHNPLFFHALYQLRATHMPGVSGFFTAYLHDGRRTPTQTCLNREIISILKTSVCHWLILT